MDVSVRGSIMAAQSIHHKPMTLITSAQARRAAYPDYSNSYVTNIPEILFL